MVNLFRNAIAKRTRIAVLGNPVRDAYLDVEAIDFPDRRVVSLADAEDAADVVAGRVVHLLKS